MLPSDTSSTPESRSQLPAQQQQQSQQQPQPHPQQPQLPELPPSPPTIAISLASAPRWSSSAPSTTVLPSLPNESSSFVTASPSTSTYPPLLLSSPSLSTEAPVQSQTPSQTGLQPLLELEHQQWQPPSDPGTGFHRYETVGDQDDNGQPAGSRHHLDPEGLLSPEAGPESATLLRNSNNNLLPPGSSSPASAAAWEALSRVDTQGSFEREPSLNNEYDRSRPGMPHSMDSQDPLLANAQAQGSLPRDSLSPDHALPTSPSTPSSYRQRRFNSNNLSALSTSSATPSRSASRSLTPTTPLSSMRDALGRASSRVVNFGSARSRPEPVPAVPAIPALVQQHQQNQHSAPSIRTPQPSDLEEARASMDSLVAKSQLQGGASASLYSNLSSHIKHKQRHSSLGHPSSLSFSMTDAAGTGVAPARSRSPSPARPAASHTSIPTPQEQQQQYQEQLEQQQYQEQLEQQHYRMDPVLEGRSLFIFGPDSGLRIYLNKMLNQTWIELSLLLLLFLNLVFLIIQSSAPGDRVDGWGQSWVDYGLLAIFVIYTIEIASRIIVSGLFVYPDDEAKFLKFFSRTPERGNLQDSNPTLLRKQQTMLAAAANAKAAALKASATGSVPASGTAAGITATTSPEKDHHQQPLSTIPGRQATFVPDIKNGRTATLIDFAVGRQTAVTQYLPVYLDPLLEYKPQFLTSGRQVPFLRHTFNRIDFVAVVCYWIDLVLMLMGVQRVYIFKTIAALRTLRLLNITSGSETILHSLKKSAPLMVNVALFIAFFFMVFSIIGVQAFKGSFSRRCVLRTDATQILQSRYCGGFYDLEDSTQTLPYLMKDGTPSPTSAKGHICPLAYVCQDVGQNYHNTVSFDNIYSAMVPVYVMMTGQTWTDLMYLIMDAEYSWSSIYFVVVILVMNFWILNLFIAVINEMFAKIRDDSAQNSAFASDQKSGGILNESIEGFTYRGDTGPSFQTKLINVVEHLEFFWAIAIVISLVFSALERYNMSIVEKARLDRIEFWFTVAFALDIFFRFLVHVTRPGRFFSSKKNNFDLFLAVVTLVIQIGPIHSSAAYKYLTVFQVLRIYRPIIYIDRLRSLIIRVVGSLVGLANLVFFIVLFLGIVSVMSGLLFRGVVDNQETMNFSDFYTSYLGVYQLFSGENWTDVLYSVMEAELMWRQVVFGAIFIITFYSFANFVLVNMLIAIIMENFELAEHDKRAQQIEEFVAKMDESRGRLRISKWNLYQYLKPIPNSIGVDYMQSGLIHSTRMGLVRQFLLGDSELFQDQQEGTPGAKRMKVLGMTAPTIKMTGPAETTTMTPGTDTGAGTGAGTPSSGTEGGAGTPTTTTSETSPKRVRIQAASSIPITFQDSPPAKNPFTYQPARQDTFGTVHATRSDIDASGAYGNVFLSAVPRDTDLDSLQDDRDRQSGQHPMRFFSVRSFQYRSLFIFSCSNPVRMFCQKLVPPGSGYRTLGVKNNVMWSRPFNTVVTLAILGCVLVAVVTTPAWRMKDMLKPPEDRSLAVKVSDIVFPVIFTIEFFIRVIADGFIFTPDAYMKTLWNQIDFFVLLTLYVPLIANVYQSQGVSRFFRSLKALRALRLINQSSYIKETFHAVLVAGFPKLLDATMLSLCMIVPFAIYGLHMYSGLFFGCNDTSAAIQTVADCTGVFLSTDHDGVALLLPRVWSNPEVYSFDNFGSAFLILFEIVSQEGWIGVQSTARNVMGYGLQLGNDSSRYNAIFFVIFNLAGGYFVTSLFVAVVIENYTMRTGTALMTANQRRWMDLKRLLEGIKMTRRQRWPPKGTFRAWCFRLAIDKKGWLSRLITVVTILNGILLATEGVNSLSSTDAEWIKNWIFIVFLAVYLFDNSVKYVGLGWKSFHRNRWNVYNGAISLLATLVTVLRLCGSTWQPLIQAQKLLLTALLFNLVHRSDSLNQLFMTMASSMKSILSLLAVWFVVFTVYGIMFVEIFGLTKMGRNGTAHVNFRDFATALLMMVRMSTGEGWNDLMHDFTLEAPYCVNQPENFLESDCGSTGWAYTLFISFNIVSMYIFTNMFIVVVMHNFSYVYQIAPGFSLVSRDEIRGFKRVWAETDESQSGYLQEKDLAKFLMNLRGVFDLRIHKPEHSLQKLQSRFETIQPKTVSLSAKEIDRQARELASRPSHKVAAQPLNLNETVRQKRRKSGGLARDGSAGSMIPMSELSWPASPEQQQSGLGTFGSSGQPMPSQQRYEPDLTQFNLNAFNSAVGNMDRAAIKKRRRIYNFLYVEAVLSMVPIPEANQKKKAGFLRKALRRRNKNASESSTKEHDEKRTSSGHVRLGGDDKAEYHSEEEEDDDDDEHEEDEGTVIGGTPSGQRFEMNTLSRATGKKQQDAKSQQQQQHEQQDQEPAPMGLSFQKTLQILAHYKLIEDDQCLLIGDLLRHRQKMDRVYAEVSVAKVKSTLLMVVLRQRFLRHYQEVCRIRALAAESEASAAATAAAAASAARVAGATGATAGPGTYSSFSSPGSEGTVVGGSGSGAVGFIQQHRPGQGSVGSLGGGYFAGVTTGVDSAPGSSTSSRPGTYQPPTYSSLTGSFAAAAAAEAASQSPPKSQSQRRTPSYYGDKAAIEEEELVDRETAELKVESLRSEWRSFLSSHQVLEDSVGPVPLMRASGVGTRGSVSSGAGVGGQATPITARAGVRTSGSLVPPSAPGGSRAGSIHNIDRVRRPSFEDPHGLVATRDVFNENGDDDEEAGSSQGGHQRGGSKEEFVHVVFE